MNRVYRIGLPAVALAGALVASTVVHACTIDGKATASVNGQRAVRAPLVTKPLPASVARTWAMFTFNGHYTTRSLLHLVEDRAQLKLALSAETMKQTWRWDFGDGAHASGWSVTHRYTRAGTYRITVSSYYPAFHKYFAFDEVRIVVGR